MGSKHDLLTEDEIRTFQLHPRVLQFLQECAGRLGIAVRQLRVLDWGCGRGRTVTKLLEMGIDAYGVDIDPGPIKNGSQLLRTRGETPEQRLICIKADCHTQFVSGSFDVVLSDQVFEHVRDLDALATELARITKPGGGGLHIYPAKWRVTEPHLYVPFVHWLPKNQLRRWYLRLWLKRIPVWNELEGKSATERVRVYYDYSIEKTYYRSLRLIRKALAEQGFTVKHQSSGQRGCNPEASAISNSIKTIWRIGILGWWSSMFREVALYTVRL